MRSVAIDPVVVHAPPKHPCPVCESLDCLCAPERWDADERAVITGGPALLWQGREYRVIETRECAKPDASDWHEHYFDGEPWDRCTQPDHPKRHRVLVERLLRTDAFGVPQWGECDGLPPEAIRDMLRALALGGCAA